MSKFNVNLGKRSKREFFDFSHDVNTTADFGFCQPLLGMEMMPNSKAKVTHNSIVRLAPMPCPTYGHVQYRTWNSFVNYSDLWKPFHNFLTKQSYRSSVTTYIPSYVPFMTVKDLSSVLLSYSYMTAYLDKGSGNYEEVPTTDYQIVEQSFKDAFHSQYASYITAPIADGSMYGNSRAVSSVTVDGADYVLFGDTYMYCIKLNTYGKNLRKILYGLGYKFDILNTRQVSVLPLFAYYKAWYDIFNIDRSSHWNVTNAFYLLDYLAENADYRLNFTTVSTYVERFKGFFNDLVNCYVTDEQTFIGAHTVSPAQTNRISLDFTYPDGGQSSVAVNTNQQGIYLNAPIVQSNLSALQRLYNRVNKNTVLGQNIRGLMRTLFGASVDMDDSNFIGGSSTDINISDVMSLSGSPGENLGEYAGKGYGLEQGKEMTFETREDYGIWITLAAIHPYGSYVQGIDYRLYHLTPEDFPQSEFDSLGMQVSEKDVVNGELEVTKKDGVSLSNSQFGFIPRYMECKVMSNVLNGDMSRRSTRSSFLPYTLDKYITPIDVSFTSVGQTADNMREYEGITVNNVQTPAASDAWRYIGRFPYLQNSDRIFNNSGTRLTSGDEVNPIDDNFIIHNYFKIEMLQPLASISDSFETFDKDTDDSSSTVEHS